MASAVPYIVFNGQANEAFEFYQQVFGGEVTGSMTFEQFPGEMPESHRSKIMHSCFESGSLRLMASDQFPGAPETSGNLVQILVDADSDEQTEEFFSKLSEGGTVTMPIAKQFWGAMFGSVTDKFGVNWMLHGPMS